MVKSVRKTKKTPGQLCFVQKEERKDITSAVREFISNQAHGKTWSHFFSRPGKTNYNIKLSSLWLNEADRLELATHMKERFNHPTLVFNMNTGKMHPYSKFWAGTQVRFFQTEAQLQRFCELERIRGINGIPVVDLPASASVKPEDLQGVPVVDEPSVHIAFADDEAEGVASMMGDITEEELAIIQQLRNDRADLYKMKELSLDAFKLHDTDAASSIIGKISKRADKIHKKWSRITKL